MSFYIECLLCVRVVLNDHYDYVVNESNLFPKEFDPVEICMPLAITETVNQGFGNGEKREIVLSRNIHTSCLALNKSPPPACECQEISW
jgi:hypothetical protein